MGLEKNDKKLKISKKFVAFFLILCMSVGIIASVWSIAISARSKVELVGLKESQEDYMVGIRERLLVGSGYVSQNPNIFCDFDLDQAYLDNVKFNDVQFLGTHNSYKAKSTAVMYASEPLYFNRFTYYFDPLFEQLEKGIFSFELDIRATATEFLCMHKPYGDFATNGYNMALTLEEIAIWSSLNVGHLPITIMIEPKSWSVKNKDRMEITDDGVMERFDQLLVDSFGDKLFTPRDMLKDTYSNLSEAAEANAWPTLSEMRDKIVFMFTMDAALKYIDMDPTLKTQKMFPAVRMELPSKNARYALHRAFTWIDESFIADKEEIKKAEKRGNAEYIVSDTFMAARNANLYIRTRIDKYNYYSVAAVPLVLAAGGNILSTDYPPHLNDRDDYIIPLEKTVFLKSG